MRFEAFKDLTRIEQTLFGLPFLLGGALLPLAEGAKIGVKSIWILPAFLLARISGMAFNQLIDRHIDARNPRTKHRAIPTGRVSVGQARVIAWGALLLFLLVCFQINLLCALFAPFAALLIFGYSYLKRFHASCHFILGGIHFLGPVMAAIAISGFLSLPSIFLGCMACFLLVGNDIAYAVQDYEFDSHNLLHSLPSRVGIKKSLVIGALLHGLCPLMLIGVGIAARLPLFFYLSLPIVGIFLVHFHSTLWQKYKKTGSLRGIESSFFFSNVSVSSTSFFFVCTGIIWRVMW